MVEAFFTIIGFRYGFLMRFFVSSTLQQSKSDCSEGLFKVLQFLFLVCSPGAPADNFALGRFFAPYENYSWARLVSMSNEDGDFLKNLSKVVGSLKE